MFPLFNIGPYTIGLYGVCCTLGIGLAILLTIFNARRTKIDLNDIILVGASILIGGFVGAKLLYFIVEMDSIINMFQVAGINKDTVMNIIQGGFVFYGGFIGGLAALLICAHSLKISPRFLMALVAPALPLAHAFGRVGCFMAGCCYGIPSEKFGIAFTQSIGAPNGIKLFPVQLLEAGLLLILAIIMQLYYRKAKHNHCVIYVYMLIYPVIRIITERFRYDDAERGIYLGLSTSTWISLAILAAGIIMLMIEWKKGFPAPPEPDIVYVYEDENSKA